MYNPTGISERQEANHFFAFIKNLSKHALRKEAVGLGSEL
jgi:hypothetical protein